MSLLAAGARRRKIRISGRALHALLQPKMLLAELFTQLGLDPRLYMARAGGKSGLAGWVEIE
jgi:hypothetical protein